MFLFLESLYQLTIAGRRDSRVTAALLDVRGDGNQGLLFLAELAVTEQGSGDIFAGCPPAA
jgi:hypothetical protein